MQEIRVTNEWSAGLKPTVFQKELEVNLESAAQGVGEGTSGDGNNRRRRISTDGMATRTRSYNCCATPTSTSGGRPKGNISGGEITRDGK